MLAAGGSPELIMNLADIYQWSVNFFTLQKGDRFRTVYTQSVCDGEFVGIDTVHFSLFDGTGYKQTAAVRFDTGEGNGNTYWDKNGESLKRMFLKAPLKYNRISSRFSYSRRHPVTGKVKPHTAVDYAAPTGTPVHAIGDGTVTKCGWDPTGGGNRIRIKHNMGYESSYMHLSKFASGVRVGTRVTQGQLIGYVGATGTATGPHLDFRIWENGRTRSSWTPRLPSLWTPPSCATSTHYTRNIWLKLRATVPLTASARQPPFLPNEPTFMNVVSPGKPAKILPSS